MFTRMTCASGDAVAIDTAVKFLPVVVAIAGMLSTNCVAFVTEVTRAPLLTP